MTFEVRCPCCMRTEEWVTAPDPHRVNVRTPGGQRQPAVAAPLAAWRTITAVAGAPDRSIYGPCDGCGQPLVAHIERVSSRSYDLVLPGGTLRYDGTWTGPEGALGPDEVEARVRAAVPAPARAGPVALAFTTFAAGLATTLAALFVLGWGYLIFLAFQIGTGQVLNR